MKVRIISKEELAECLLSSFHEWPKHAQEDSRDELNARCKGALSSIGDSRNFERIIDHTIDSTQLDWSIDNARKKLKSSMIDRASGVRWIDRWKKLRGLDEFHSINISTSIHIHAISIPDPAKDEIALDIRVYSGCDLNELLEYLVHHGLLQDQNQAIKIRDQWCHTNLQNPDHKELLEHVLDVVVDKVSAEHRRRVIFSLGDSSGFVWRFCDTLCILPLRLELSKYPFDKTPVSILLKNAQVGHFKRLIPDATDRYGKAINTDHMISPRGFMVGNFCDDLRMITFSESADTHLDHRLLFSFELSRLTDTFIWRVMFPTIMILLLCIAATAAVFLGFKKIDANAVLTSVIPSVLIASVAMQLTASQTTPAQSGRTWIDVMFVGVYVIILANFVLLIIFPAPSN